MKKLRLTRESLILASVLSITAFAGISAETTVGGSNNKAAQALFDSGTKKLNSGNPAGAVRDFTQAIAIDPNYWKAYGNRAGARFNAHDYKGALADIDVVSKHMPSMPYFADLRQKCQNAMAESPRSAGNVQVVNRQRANALLQQALLGGDLSEPSTLLMMRAQRAGLMNGGGGARRPMVNPFAAHPLTSGQPVNLTPGQPASLAGQPVNLTPGAPPADEGANSSDVSGRLAATTQEMPARAESSSPQATATNPFAEHAGSGIAESSGGKLTAKEYFDRGCARSKSLDFKGAIEEFSQSIALGNRSGDAFANRGLARMHIGDCKGALEDLQQADRLIPNNQELKHYIELAKQAAGR